MKKKSRALSKHFHWCGVFLILFDSVGLFLGGGGVWEERNSKEEYGAMITEGQMCVFISGRGRHLTTREGLIYKSPSFLF